MKRISYCGKSFLTTDGAADALVQLVVALPDGHHSEMLEVPAVTNGGDEMLVQLVVGPRSELISIPEESASGELDTVEVVAYLRGRVQVLTAPRELAFEEAFATTEFGGDTEFLLLQGRT